MLQTSKYGFPLISESDLSVKGNALAWWKKLGLPKSEGGSDEMCALEKIDKALAEMSRTLATVTISPTQWASLNGNAKFKWTASATVSVSISNDTIVELLNDNPTLFATYGIQIASADSTTIVFYAIAKPENDISLKILIGG